MQPCMTMSCKKNVQRNTIIIPMFYHLVNPTHVCVCVSVFLLSVCSVWMLPWCQGELKGPFQRPASGKYHFNLVFFHPKM